MYSKLLSFTTHIFIPAVFLLLCIRKYKERNWGKCRNSVKLNGKIAIVTGANSGMGYEVTKALAIRGAHVIMACRDLHKADVAVCKLKRELSCSSVIFPMELDLESIPSIRRFVEEIKMVYSSIDILINNAGVSFPKHLRCKTKTGFEIHFAVNYLGHFVLTNLLIDLLKNAESSRIIIISSLMHELGKIHLYDLNLDGVTEPNDPYANSKLANIYFCKELVKRLQGTHIDVYAVCPGWVYTNLFRHQTLKWYHFLFSLPAALLFLRTPNQGAQTAIYCATESNLKTGAIYRNCEEYKSHVDFDGKIASKLWDISQEMAEKADSELKMTNFFGVLYPNVLL